MRWWPRRKLYLDNLPKTHDLRFAVIFILGLALVFGALYGVGYAVAGNTVPRGTTVSDVEIGTLSRGEAETTLREELVPRLQRPLTLESARRTFRIDPQTAGVTLDVESTVHDAMSGGDWDPRHMLQVIFGGDEIDPVVAIDDHEFQGTLARVVRQVRVRPTDSRVVFAGGRPKARYGESGETVDLERLKELVAEALRHDERRVRIPMRAVAPHITRDEADRFVRTVARPAVQEPVRLTARGATVILEPAGFAAGLRALTTPDGLRLGIDPKAAYRLGAPTRAKLPGQPTDARVVLRGGGPVVVPGRAGFRISQQAWADGVLAAALRRPSARTAALDVVSAPPRFRTEDAKALRIRVRIASFTTRFPGSIDRRLVARAARQLDGVVLRPGSYLSYLRRVRAPGQSAASTVVATATYNAALLAGLDVPDRSWIPRLPAHLPRGREALARRPRDDLGLHNALPYGVLLHAAVEDTREAGAVRVEAWSSRYWQVDLRLSGRRDVSFAPPIRRAGPRCIPRPGEPAYTVDLTRIRKNGDQRRVDVHSSRYAPVRAVVCGPARGGQR